MNSRRHVILAMLAATSTGCAATQPLMPLAAPAAVAAAQPSAPAVAAPAQAPVTTPAVAAPAQTTPAPVASVTYAGHGKFRGEALAGYAVTVVDVATGKPFANVISQDKVTGPDGAFKLAIPPLQPGQAVKVQLTKGNSSVEALITAPTAAKKYLLADDQDMTIDEMTTALAGIAENVIAATTVLSAADAQQVIDDMNAKLATLQEKIQRAYKNQPDLANALVTPDEAKKKAEKLNDLMSAAGAIFDSTKMVAELVKTIADKEHTAFVKPNAELADRLKEIEFTGTALIGKDFDTQTMEVRNRLTGNSGTGGDLNVTSVSAPPSGGGGSAPAPAPAPVSSITISGTQVSWGGIAPVTYPALPATGILSGTSYGVKFDILSQTAIANASIKFDLTQSVSTTNMALTVKPASTPNANPTPIFSGPLAIRGASGTFPAVARLVTRRVLINAPAPALALQATQTYTLEGMVSFAAAGTWVIDVSVVDKDTNQTVFTSTKSFEVVAPPPVVIPNPTCPDPALIFPNCTPLVGPGGLGGPGGPVGPF